MSTLKAIPLDNFEKLRRCKEHTVVTIEPGIRKTYLNLYAEYIMRNAGLEEA